MGAESENPVVGAWFWKLLLLPIKDAALSEYPVGKLFAGAAAAGGAAANTSTTGGGLWGVANNP